MSKISHLVLEIPDLSKKDSLFNFLDGLQPLAKTDSLIDYTSHKESSAKPKDKKSGQIKGGGDKRQRKEGHQDDDTSRHKESSSWKGKAKAKDFQGPKRPSSNNYFICDGDH
ncbi:hypothetical protein V6N13_083311 [Hibiscus sabdariffa]